MEETLLTEQKQGKATDLLSVDRHKDGYRKKTGNVKKLSGGTCRKYKGLRVLWQREGYFFSQKPHRGHSGCKKRYCVRWNK